MPLFNPSIPATIVDAKGDLIAASADDTVVRLSVGSAGTYPRADSSATAGIAWRYAESSIDLLRSVSSGIHAQTFDFYMCRNDVGINVNDNIIRYQAIYLPYDQTLTGIKWIQVVTGNTTGDQNNKVGLYTSDGTTLTRVAQSTNDLNLWDVATGNAGKAFSSTYAASAGLYYIATLGNYSAITTTPTVAGITSVDTALLNPNGCFLNGSVSGSNDLPATQLISGISKTSAASMYWLGLY